MNQEIRIVLDEAAFRALVRGGEVWVKDVNVRLILKDIGWHRMDLAVTEASQNLYKPVTVNSHGEEIT